MSNFETIDPALLVTATGGAGGAPTQDFQDDEPQGRTWGQMGRDYAAACVQGAGQALLSGERPRSVREGVTNAALGCATGMGMRAIDDVSAALSGR